jgi:hypothetical protein
MDQMSPTTLSQEQPDMAERSLATVQQDSGAVMETVITKGDLKDLSPKQRAEYYAMVCTSMGLNPLTKPFDFITLNGKLTLYATKGATDQLRGQRNVTVAIESREQVGDLYVVTATARTPDGRADSDIGAVNVKGLAGEALANAMMKATTKAKRRVTLSLCGLGWLDESEVDSIPNVQRPAVDIQTGEIVEPEPAKIGELPKAKRKTDAQPVDDMTDQDYANEVGAALAAGDGLTYKGLVAAAGDHFGRWAVLLDQADTDKARQWVLDKAKQHLSEEDFNRLATEVE